MRRRSFLLTLGASTGVGGARIASAHPKGEKTEQGTPPNETPVGDDPLGTVPIENAKEAVVRDETTVFVATTDGFATVDASDPADLTVTYQTAAVLDDHEGGPLEGVWDVKVDGDRLLLAGPANSGHDGVHAAVVYDVADAASPQRESVHETDYPIHNCFLTDGVAYLTANDGDGNPLVTVDAESGEERGRWSLFDHDEAWEDVDSFLRVLHDVWVRNGYAYLAHWDAGTCILDVSDPASPEFVSRVRGRPVEELAAVDDVVREARELPGNDHFTTVDDSGDILGVGIEAWANDGNSSTGPGGIYLYDISDPADPSELAHVEPPPTADPTREGVWTTAHNFELTADRLYSSWYQGGVKVHDLSDPANPRELFHWRDARRAKFWAAQVGVPGEFFVGSSWETPGEEDESGGLYTFPEPERGTPATATSPAPDGDAISVSGDGFGWIGALGGALLAAGAWSRRQRGDSDGD